MMGITPATSPQSLLRDSDGKRGSGRGRRREGKEEGVKKEGDINMNFAPFNARAHLFLVFLPLSFHCSSLRLQWPSFGFPTFVWSDCKHGNYGLCESLITGYAFGPGGRLPVCLC